MPFGSLRQPNDSNAVDVLLNILQQIINVDPITGLGNTIIAQLSVSGTGVERTYIENKAAMTLGDFPSLLLTTGPQKTKLAGKNQYETEHTVNAIYYNRWDRSPATIDAIHTAMRQDLERMKANLETNQGLVYQGAYHAVSLPTIEIGGYDEELDDKLPSITLVKCPMVLTINSLPYDA